MYLLKILPSVLAPSSWWHSQAARQSALISLANLIAAGLMAVAMIVAARIMGPDSFGAFSLMTSLMFILTKGADLGLHQLVPRLYHRWEEQPKLRAGFTSWLVRRKLLASGLMILGSLALLPYWQSWFGLADQNLVLLAILGAVILSWYEIIYLALTAQHRFLEVSLMTVAQATFKAIGFGVIALLVLVWLGREAGASQSVLLWISTVYVLSSLVGIWWLGVLKDWWQASRRARSLDKRVSQAIRTYWPHAAIGSSSLVLIQNLDLVLVVQRLSTFETGIYAGALRVSLFVSIFTFGVGSVLNNRITRYRQKEQIVSYLKKSLIFSVLALSGFLVFLPLAGLIIYWTIGPSYVEGLQPFIVLVGSAFLGLSLAPYASYFFHLRLPWANSVSGLLQLSLIVGINLLFLDQYGLMAAAYARLAATLGFALMVVILLTRSWKGGFSDVGGE